MSVTYNVIKDCKTKKLFNIYIFLIFAILPMVIDFRRGEPFYTGKIVFAVVVTFTYILIASKRYIISKEKNSLIYWFLYFLIVIPLLSSIFSIDVGLSIFGEPKCPEGVISLVIYIGIFYICYKDFTYSKVVFEAILIVSTLIGLYGILNYFEPLTGIEKVLVYMPMGGLSTIGNRNFVGTYCTLLIPLAIGFYLRYRHKRIVIYSGILFGLLMVTKTRSAWIATSLGIGLLFFITLGYALSVRNNGNKNSYFICRNNVYIALSFVIVFGGIFGVVDYYKDSELSKRFQSIIVDAQNIDDDRAASGRIYFWKKTIMFLDDYPLLGSGPDTYGKLLFQNNVTKEIVFPKVHNEYLQMAVTLGYPYLCIYICLIAIILSRLIKKAVKSGDYLAISLFCSIIAYLIQAFFNISVISTAPIYWGLLGIGAKVGEISDH